MTSAPVAPFGRMLTAMATPFLEDGSVDLDGVQRVAKHLLGHGHDGLVVSGTTGESPTTTTDEDGEVLAAVRERGGPRSTALLATLPGAAELIPIDLGPVERINELRVIQRPFHASNDATAGLIGQPLELRVTDNQKRYALNGITDSVDRLGDSCILAIHHRDCDI